MEGSGGGNGKRGKKSKVRRPFRGGKAAPTVEEEIPEVEMVEEEAPMVNLEAAAMARKQAMKKLQRLARGCRETLADETGVQVDLDLRRFLTFFLGRLLFATRGDAVHFRFVPLLEDLGQVGDYAWGAAFLAHQFESLGSSDRQTLISGFYPFLQEVDEGQPWLELTRPYFDRRVWIHALNLVLPLHLYLTQRSLGLRQSAVKFPSRDRTPRPGRSFRGLHDTTDWCVRAHEQIEDWEHHGRRVRSEAVSDDAYLQAFALKYGTKVYRGARRQVDDVGEIASLRAFLHSAVQYREISRREVEQLGAELASVRRAQAGDRAGGCYRLGSPLARGGRDINSRGGSAARVVERGPRAPGYSDGQRPGPEQEQEWSEWGEWRLRGTVLGRFLQSAEERGGGGTPGRTGECPKQ
ncbi:hypothetical protein Taro_027446 [Colocasia esculenta]|uniref:Aminotransferase-like plant mobile domain-containing protein n=1 Tax=Colocasia esculenta TaxID=4460 RepID=A0A843VI53_COLES|nr:hypothetical protein [Colocasia esculenta]